MNKKSVDGCGQCLGCLLLPLLLLLIPLAWNIATGVLQGAGAFFWMLVAVGDHFLQPLAAIVSREFVGSPMEGLISWTLAGAAIGYIIGLVSAIRQIRQPTHHTAVVVALMAGVALLGFGYFQGWRRIDSVAKTRSAAARDEQERLAQAAELQAQQDVREQALRNSRLADPSGRA